MKVRPKSSSFRSKSGEKKFVDGEVHYWTKTPFTDPQNSVLDHLADQAKFTGGEERYNISKLFDIFIAREMAKLPIVQSGKVTVCSVNPGESI